MYTHIGEMNGVDNILTWPDTTTLLSHRLLHSYLKQFNQGRGRNTPVAILIMGEWIQAASMGDLKEMVDLLDEGTDLNMEN